MRKEGRRRDGNEGNNPCEISLTDTDFCVYIRPEFIIHPWLFILLFFPGNSLFPFKFLESLLCCKLVCIYHFICLEGTSYAILFLPGWIQLVCDPPRSMLAVHNFIILVLLLCVWLIRMHLCTTSAISFILSEDILWFCVLASVRNTTVNVGVHVSFWTVVFSGT